jgi:3-oxoadipate enol-lactonase
MSDSGFVEVEGGRLYYEVEGDGHPLLLIHGGLGSLRMWDEQAPSFADSFMVIRYDTRGFGRTETDDVEFTNRGDAAAVLEHLGVKSASVIGQSRGGVIALDLAIEQPKRVDALVSVAGGVGGYEPELARGVEPPPWDEMERLWEAKDWDTLAELETQVWVDGWGQPADRVDPGLRAKVKDWILSNYRAGLSEGKPQPLQPSAAQRLGEVRMPLLVLIGDVDEPGCVVAEHHLAGAVPGARSVVFPGVAHMIHLEQPGRFNEVVLDFLVEASSLERQDLAL